ncbi:MAG TPA: TolC family protein [Gemmatimonadaceae bacterium]|jgi:outer membrane protein TolC|nr:TolC family protein [Gemmatimonadaceae bacterium]
MITALLLAVAMQVPAQDSTSLTLTAFVTRALNTHPSVASARALNDRALADLNQARAHRLPSLSVQGAFNQFDQPMVVAPLHGLDFNNPPLFDRTLYQAGIAMNWTVLDFGRRTAQVNATRALQRAAGDAVAASEQDLIASTVHAYLAVCVAQLELTAQDQLLKALQSAADRTGQLEAQGKAAHVDVLRMSAAVQRARADRISAASQLELAERRLARLTDTPMADILQAGVPAVALTPAAATFDSTGLAPDALTAQAMDASSELRQVEQRAQAAKFGVDAARATWLPSVQLQGGYIDRGSSLGNYGAEWQVGVALAYPLYTGGGRGNAVRSAEASQHAAAQQVRAARMTVEQQLDQATAALRDARARVSALRSATAASEEVARIQDLALNVGTVVQTDYLDAQAKLMAAHVAQSQAEYAEVAARVDLARILGELSVDWLAHNLGPNP